MTDLDKIKAEIQQYGMSWVRQQPADPELTPEDVTVPRVQAHFGFHESKTAKDWLIRNGFIEGFDAIDRNNRNRHVKVWVKGKGESMMTPPVDE